MEESRLVLGTVQFGLKYGIANTGGRPEGRGVREILQKAYDKGIRTLDTAAAYGESEVVLGRELSALNLLDRVKIISKVPPLPENISEGEAEKFIFTSVERSLGNLKINQLEAILFHREKDLKYLNLLKKVQNSGLVRLIGVSMDGEIPDSAYGCQAVQVPGNVFDRRFLKFLEKAHDNGCRIYNRSVYLQGLLLMDEKNIPQALQVLIPYRRKLENLAADCGISPGELYMRYLLSIRGIDGVLTGVDSVEQLEYNCLVSGAGALPDEVMAKIFDIIPEFPESLIRPSLWASR